MEKQSLFIPTAVPWKDVRGKDLEELLYWLFDAMGARDLEWRLGGQGGGSADHGRDLELSFYISSPDGELSRQRWWVEGKGRTGTVEPAEVKNAVLNAAGNSKVDVLVVATNSVYSNPTRDWVAEWQRDHPRPVVKLWERTQLESLCSKHPIAVVRLYGQALSPQGKLEVACTRFWEYYTFTDEGTLTSLWENQDTLQFDWRTLVALISSEFANGEIALRSWPTLFDSRGIVEALAHGLVNFPYMLFRAENLGGKQTPVIRCLAYLTLVTMRRIGRESTSRLLESIWNRLGIGNTLRRPGTYLWNRS